MLMAGLLPFVVAAAGAAAAVRTMLQPVVHAQALPQKKASSTTKKPNLLLMFPDVSCDLSLLFS